MVVDTKPSVKVLVEEITGGSQTEAEIKEEAIQAVVEELCADNELARYPIAIALKRLGQKEYSYEHTALFEKTHFEVWREILAEAVERYFTKNDISDPIS